MRFIRAIAIVALAALVVTPSMTVAQEVLTLDDCIELALQNRASVIAARGSYRVAKWDKAVAIGQFLPRLNADYSYADTREWDIESEGSVTVIDSAFLYRDSLTFIDGIDSQVVTTTIIRDSIVAQHQEVRTFDLPDQDRKSKNLSVDASMWLINVPSWFNLAAAGAAKARENLNILASELDMALSVKVAYYLFLAAVERVETDAEAVRRSEEQLKLIESMYELGSASRSDLLKQRVRLGQDRLTLLQAQNAVITTRADLAYTVGIDPRADIEFSTEYPVRTYEGELDEVIQFALDHNPSLLASIKDVDLARHNVRSQWAGYLPTLSGFASFSMGDGTRGDTVTFDFSSKSRTFGFRVNWTIFDGFLRERQLVAAKVGLNTARAVQADQNNQTVARVQSAFLEIEQLEEQLQVAQETVDAAEEDMRITQERYNLGAATILDLLNAQVSLKEAQVGLIRATFDMNLAIARLENAMGMV